MVRAYSDQLKKAWELFIESGTIDTSVVKPEIADSWLRCYKNNSLSYSSSFLSSEMIKTKQYENKHLIETARPVMYDINEAMNNISNSYAVALFDIEGDIIDLIDKKNQIIKLGHKCTEVSGTVGPVGIALRTGHMAETVAHEHLYPHAHNWHAVGCAIYNYDQSITGFFSVINLKGHLPAIKSIVYLGTRLIEAGIVREQIAHHNSSVLLDIIPQMALVISEEGRIYDANNRFLDYTGLTCNDLYRQPVDRFITGNINFSNLTSSSIIENEFKNVSIKSVSKKTGNYSETFTAVKKIIRDEKNLPIILIVFEENHKHPAKKVTPAEVRTDSQCITFRNITGESPAITEVKVIAQRASHSLCNILIEGDSGTGKDMLAQAIHHESDVTGPFIAINCGAIPKDLLYSELFGYEEGAFTGAQKGGRPGKFEIADGGTLFLDEVGEMSPDMQVSLLRFLQDKTITRVGGAKTKKVEVRIIAATNRNLLDEVAKGNFREDLYYRLNVIQICMPPLKERTADLPLIINDIIGNLARQFNCAPKVLHDDVLQRLTAYGWPGNIRELKNVLERAFVFADDVITINCLPAYINRVHLPETIAVSSLLHDQPNRGINLKDHEMIIITDTLERYNYNISKAASELGIARNTLYKKIEEFGLKR